MRTVMISFPLGDKQIGEYENMHASQMDGGNYRIENSPFHVYGISYGDVVSTIFKDKRLVFSEVVQRGGHSTYRIRLLPNQNHADFLKFWYGFSNLGCSYEGSSVNTYRLYSIDVPNEVDVNCVYKLLAKLEKEQGWEFEEAYYSGS